MLREEEAGKVTKALARAAAEAGVWRGRTLAGGDARHAARLDAC